MTGDPVDKPALRRSSTGMQVYGIIRWVAVISELESRYTFHKQTHTHTDEALTLHSPVHPPPPPAHGRIPHLPTLAEQRALPLVVHSCDLYRKCRCLHPHV